jgi:hypothetical protein
VQKKTRSLLAELDQHYLVRDKENFVESKALNIIQGAINLLSYIKENYDTESAAELERRLLNSIRAQDSSKFSRGLKRLKESGNENN